MNVLHYVLGLDVSTSNTGVALLDAGNGSIALLDHIDFKGCETFWQKCDKLKDSFESLGSKYMVTSFYIEEPMKRFAEGFSSAEVISMLQRFNGIACYLARDVWRVDPDYLNVSSARKLCGIKVTTKAKAGGKNVKQQVFDHMAANDLKHITWPLKQRSTNIVDWAGDVTDAYVIAKAGYVLNSKPA